MVIFVSGVFPSSFCLRFSLHLKCGGTSCKSFPGFLLVPVAEFRRARTKLRPGLSGLGFSTELSSRRFSERSMSNMILSLNPPILLTSNQVTPLQLSLYHPIFQIKRWFEPPQTFGCRADISGLSLTNQLARFARGRCDWLLSSLGGSVGAMLTLVRPVAERAVCVCRAEPCCICMLYSSVKVLC